MAVSTSRLIGLPIEILEQIILHLPAQDIIKMDVIGRRFRDLTHSSPELQCRRELFAAGLIDNPYNPCGLDERRRLCKEYVHKWSDVANVANGIRDVSLERPFSGWGNTMFMGRNLLAIRAHQSDTVDFLHIPPAMSRVPPERWSIPNLPFEFLHFKAYPPENMLVVTDDLEGERSIRIHLLDLLDGSPRRAPHSNVIVWRYPSGVEGAKTQGLALAGSRLMLYVFLRYSTRPGGPVGFGVVLWDWKTGELVFDHANAAGSGLLKRGSQVCLLDEFRIVVVQNNFPDAPELAVFNTLVPQGHPGSLRLFKLPQKYLQRTAQVLLDRDRSLGIVNRDGHLIVDPSQAIFIIKISATFRDPQTSLVLRTQSLVEYACSKHTDIQIPWDEWGRGAVVMENPNDYGYSNAIIHGARVLVFHHTYHDPVEHYRIYAFDFSRRGSAALPLSDGNDGGTERRAVFNDDQGYTFDGGDKMDPWGVQSLGDSIPFSIAARSDCVLRVLDMI